MNALVSVVTLTHNKLAWTRRCVGSLLGTTWRPWELVVVDNGSTDGTADWLREFRSEAGRAGVAVSLLLNARNVGCSTARNQGVAAARGERIVFVDNDVALRSRGWLERLSEPFARDARVGMTGPKLVYPFPPHDIQFAGGDVSPTGRVRFAGRGRPRGEPAYNSPRECQCLISACCMIRRDLYDRLGGLDEAFNPVEYEDIDFCYRLRSHGYRILYVPSVEMYHFESVTTAGTASLPNTALIVRHGMLFKRRWRHMFATENGPPDSETAWADVPRVEFSRIGPLELTE